MRVVAMVVGLLLASAEAQAAREREWQWSLWGEVDFAQVQGAATVGYGGATAVRYGLTHWVNWEVASLAYHYVPSAKVSGVQFDLHRLDLTSSLVLQPPAVWQVHMFGVIPALGFGLGYRGDVAINRSATSPTGANRGTLDNDYGYMPVATVFGALEWRFTRDFSLLGSVRGLRGIESKSGWDVTVGGLLSYSFYGH